MGRVGKKEIENIYRDKNRQFNIPILEEGIRQAELRLKDVNAKGIFLEKRFFSLLYSFIPLIAVLVSLMIFINNKGALCTNKGFISTISQDFFLLIIFMMVLLVVIVLVFFIFNIHWYGVLGTNPRTWLEKAIIEGDDNVKGYMLANILYGYQIKIRVSERANLKIGKKVGNLLTILIAILVMSMLLLLVKSLCF